MNNLFYQALGFSKVDKTFLKGESKKLGISLGLLEYYNANNILPNPTDLEKIFQVYGKKKEVIMLKMGILDSKLKSLIALHADEILKLVPENSENIDHASETFKPLFETSLGRLYQGDCVKVLKGIPNDHVDLVFADPPFNLNKFYLSNIDDNLSKADYINWCENWLDQCVRVLKPGGAIFLWNIPKWNTFLADYMNQRLQFRHWIAADIKLSLPIQGKLYPAHYSLLYYVKGEKANTFHADRMPMEVCSVCKSDLKDYGGYKDKMNENGVNLSDVWYDIPPVRHNKYKTRKEANELSVKLLDRVIEMASNPGDIILDPFGGSGTTYIVSEMKKRKWIGIELGPCDTIIERFENISMEMEYLEKYRKNYNKLFPEKLAKERKAKGLWTSDDFKMNLVNTVEGQSIEN